MVILSGYIILVQHIIVLNYNGLTITRKYLLKEPPEHITYPVSLNIIFYIKFWKQPNLLYCIKHNA